MEHSSSSGHTEHSSSSGHTRKPNKHGPEFMQYFQNIKLTENADNPEF